VYYHEIQTLEENRTELTTVNKFGLNPYDTKKPYFETVDGEITLSNEERVNELFNNYSNSIYSEFWEEIYPLRWKRKNTGDGSTEQEHGGRFCVFSLKP